MRRPPCSSGALGVDTPDDLPDSAKRARQLLADLRTTPNARALGSEYLARFPEEADLSLLIELLEPLDCADPSGSSSAQRTILRLERQNGGAARDFAAGRVVELSGWLLSQREARVCALASLISHLSSETAARLKPLEFSSDNPRVRSRAH